MAKKNDTVRYSGKEIKARIVRGEDKTDWRKVDKMIGARLEASIRADVDEIPGEPDWTQASAGIPAPPWSG